MFDDLTTTARIDALITAIVGPDGPPCPRCEGKGEVSLYDRRFGDWSDFECPQCDGQGTVPQ